MEKDAYLLLTAVGVCHGLLKDHARLIERKESVSSVTHWFDISTVEGTCRIEEFLDAELKDGNAISWHLETTLTPDDIAVEADVRKVHELGQDLIANVAECTYATVAEYAAEIPVTVRKLLSVNPLPND